MAGLNSIQLPTIDKSKLRELASQARADVAKRGRATTNTIPQANDVFFVEPVKVAATDAESDTIQKRLGNYEVAKKLIAGSKTDILGVDRQPPTPLPSKEPKESYFTNPRSSRNPNLPKKLVPDHISAGNLRKEKDQAIHGAALKDKETHTVGGSDRHHARPDNKKDDKHTNKIINLDHRHNALDTSVSSHKGHNPVHTKESSHSIEKSGPSHNQVTSNSTKSQSYRRSHGESKKHSAVTKPHSPNHVTASQPDKSSSHSSETVTKSKPQPGERESILAAFGKELVTNISSSAIHSNSASTSPNRKKDDLTKPAKANSNKPVDASILKVKEDNRNGMNTFNGRVRPNLHIQTEKTVEDMLNELTDIPQALTALHTPFKEGGKFPFQVPEKPQPVSQEAKKELLKETDRSTSLDMIEPIASPNEEESDDDDSISDSDSEKGLEEGEIQSEDSDDDVIAPAGMNTSSVSNSVKVPHAGPVSTTGKVTSAPVKEPRKSSSRMSSGSSDSSSSGSEDSNSSDSDSEEDKVISDDDEDNQHKNETTPTKSKSSPLEEEESPSSASKQQKWSLKSFLPTESSLLGPSSVKSVDGPWSNKSDANHYIDDIDVQPIRPADQDISDDNPPSDKIPDDHDVFSKPVCDEFSPPSLPYKHPIMSPKFSTSDIQQKNQTFDAGPLTPTNTYDTVKRRKRTPSVKSPEIQERIPRRSRKSKQVVLSPECSSSEDEQDNVVNLTSQSSDAKKVIKESPKPLPKSPIKSQSVSKTERSSTPSKASKRRENKQEKQAVEKDSVRLKNEVQEKQAVEKDSVRLKTEVRRSASKSSDCDKSVSDKSDLSSTSSTKLESDSIEKIFDKFQPESLLSPIPNVPEKSHVTSVQKETTVQKEKPESFNGSVSYHNGKPSVMVQISLDLVSIHLNLGKSKPEGKDVSNVAIPEDKIRTSEHKTELVSKPTAIENSKSERKRKSENVEVTSPNKYSSKVTSALTGNSDSCDKSKLLPSVKSSAIESFPKYVDSSKGACATKKVLSSKSPDYSSFESLPFRQSVEPQTKLAAKKHPPLSDSSSGSDSSSDSDSDEDQSMEINHLSPIPDKITEVNVQDSDLKKRKTDSHRTEDSKRRKTASKSPHNTIHKEEKEKERIKEKSKQHTAHSKERRNSNSSQHSTHSTLSTRSNQSSRGTLSQQGHGRKKVKLEPAKEPLSNSSVDHHLSSSTKHLIKSDKPEPSEVQVNGHASQLSTPNTATPTTEGNRTIVCPFWIRDQEERLEDANEYHVRAKKAKHQADAMEAGLQQNILYLEAALCFIQSGCAMERNHKVVEAANFFKETHRFVVHNPHFRMPHDPESVDKAELKLAVLCLRVQSLMYLKMFMLKKTESLKLKRVLEDHNNKSVKSAPSQPKPPPSAPSPHQAWNRSTGTPSPMSPTPSPVGSVCSVGSAGSMNELTPSKATNGTSAPLVPAGHVAVPQRIHSITQKYFTSTSYLVSCHELWDQADSAVSSDIKDFFAQLDMDCGRLTMQSSLLHLVRYVKHGLQLLKGS